LQSKRSTKHTSTLGKLIQIAGGFANSLLFFPSYRDRLDGRFDPAVKLQQRHEHIKQQQNTDSNQYEVMSSIVASSMNSGGRLSVLYVKNEKILLQHAPKQIGTEQQPTPNDNTVPRMKNDFDTLKNSISSFDPRWMEVLNESKSASNSIVSFAHQYKKASIEIVNTYYQDNWKNTSKNDDDAMTLETVKSCSTLDTTDNEILDVPKTVANFAGAKRKIKTINKMETLTKLKSNEFCEDETNSNPIQSLLFCDAIKDTCLLKSISTSKFQVLVSSSDNNKNCTITQFVTPTTTNTSTIPAHKMLVDPNDIHYYSELDPISLLLHVTSTRSLIAKSLSSNVVNSSADSSNNEVVDIEIEIPMLVQPNNGSSNGLSASFVTKTGVFVPEGVAPIPIGSLDDDDKTIKTTNTAKSTSKAYCSNQNSLFGLSFEDIDDEDIFVEMDDENDNSDIVYDSNCTSNMCNSTENLVGNDTKNLQAASATIDESPVEHTSHNVLKGSVESSATLLPIVDESDKVINCNSEQIVNIEAATKVSAERVNSNKCEKVDNPDRKDTAIGENGHELIEECYGHRPLMDVGFNSANVGIGSHIKHATDVVANDGEQLDDGTTREKPGNDNDSNNVVDSSAISSDDPIVPVEDTLSRTHVKEGAFSKASAIAVAQESLQMDITVYGCTSFTAKHVLNYFMQSSMQINMRINVTLAGRSIRKLQTLQNEMTEKMTNLRIIEKKSTIGLYFDIFVADSSDLIRLKEMAKRTKVVVNCAGMYSLFQF
jgi:hypothetical protein